LEQAQLIRELKTGQARLRQELKAVREQRGFFARWLGIGEPKPAPRAKSGTANERPS